MKHNPQIRHRRSSRLQGYDYTLAGAYFVTICVQNRECALGDIVDGEVRYSSSGRIVRDFWPEVEAHFPHVEVASFVIMPNHIHAIIIIRDVAPSEGHQSAMRRGVVTTPPTPGRRFWQRNYYEHIIRDDADLRRIEEYIQNNPRLWEQDQFHPQASPNKFNQDR